MTHVVQMLVVFLAIGVSLIVVVGVLRVLPARAAAQLKARVLRFLGGPLTTWLERQRPK